MAEPVAVLRYEVSGILDKDKVNVKPATDGAHMLQIVSKDATKVTFYYDDENEKRQPSIVHQTTDKERKVESIGNGFSVSLPRDGKFSIEPQLQLKDGRRIDHISAYKPKATKKRTRAGCQTNVSDSGSSTSTVDDKDHDYQRSEGVGSSEDFSSSDDDVEDCLQEVGMPLLKRRRVSRDGGGGGTVDDEVYSFASSRYLPSQKELRSEIINRINELHVLKEKLMFSLPSTEDTSDADSAAKTVGLLGRLNLVLEESYETYRHKSASADNMKKVVQSMEEVRITSLAAIEMPQTTGGVVLLFIPKTEGDDSAFRREAIREADFIHDLTGAQVLTGNASELVSKVSDLVGIKWVHIIAHGGANVYGKHLGLWLADDQGNTERLDAVGFLHAILNNINNGDKSVLDVVSINACLSADLVDYVTASMGIKNAWGWTTLCEASCARLFGHMFYSNYVRRGMSPDKAFDAAKHFVEMQTRVIGVDKSTQMAISDRKYAWGDPTVNPKEGNAWVAGIPLFLSKGWDTTRKYLPSCSKTWSSNIHTDE